MPVSDSTRSLYRNGLENFIATPESGFANLNSDQYGLGVNSFNTTFAEVNSLSDEDMSELSKESAPILQNFKSGTNTPRFIPKEEEFPLYYNRLSYDSSGTIENKIAAIDKWKSDSLAKASALRPADAEDFKFHLEGIANNFIRNEVGKDNKTSWAGDKMYRSIEGFARMGTAFGDFEWANRFLAENLPENPEMDQDVSSLFAAGIGELASQALVALGTSATVGPQAVPFALATIYSARSMKEGYDEQFSRDGNINKATDAAIASIPGALLETVADNMLFKGGSALRKSFADDFLNATTDAAKREVLKSAMPVIGKEVLKNGLSEATIGSIGADFTTGYGRYLASGDSSYIPNPNDLMKGALVEGVLGAGYTGLNSGNIRSEGAGNISQEMFQQNREKQGSIFAALKSGNYDEAVRIANDTTSAPTTKQVEEKVKEVSKITSSPAKSFTMPFSSASRLAQDAKSLRDKGNIAEADRLDSVSNSIRSGTYQIPDSFSKNTSFVGEEISTTPDTGITANDITLEDGTVLPKDKNILFIQGVTPNSVAEINERFNGVSLMINHTDKASLVWKENGKDKKSSDFTVSTIPRKGFLLVEVPALTFINDTTAISSSFGFVKGGAVASYKKTEASKGIIRQNPQQAQASNNTSNQLTEDQIKKEVDLADEDIGVTKAMEILDVLESNKVSEYAGNFEQDIELALDGLRDYSNRMEAEGNTEAFVTANETAENIISLYSDLKAPRWPIPRTNNIRPSDIFARNISNESDVGPLAEYKGQRGNLRYTPEGVYLNNYLISKDINSSLENIPGFKLIPTPDTEFTLGPDSSGRMYKFENGSKIYQNGESVKIVNRKGNRTGLGPVVAPSVANEITVAQEEIVEESQEEVTENSQEVITEPSKETNTQEVEEVNNITSERISPREAIDYLIEKGLGFVEIRNTSNVGPTGVQWKGRAIFFSDADARILVNIRNITNTADLVNTINEEIGHVIYNNPDLRSTIDAIISSTPIDQELLNKGYSEADLAEESVTKRFAELIDKYNEKGTFEKFLAAVKAYVKQVFGFDLNDSDLQYIANRALSRALKDPNLLKIRANRDGTVSRYSLADNNITITNANKQENNSYVKYVSDPNLSNLLGQFGQYQYSNAVKNIDSSIASNFSAHGSSKFIENVKTASERSYLLANVDSINGWFGTLKGESIGASNTFTTSPVIIVRNNNNNEEVVVYNATGPELVVPILNTINNKRKIIQPSELEEWMNKSLLNTNTSQSAYSNNTNAVAFEESEVLSQINGLISPRVKEIRKSLNKLIRSKLEQKLVISEPENWKALKTLQFQYLNENDLQLYKDIVDDFANTRRKISGGPIETNQRFNQDNLKAELARLNKAAAQGRFDFLQRDNEFLQDKDFQNDFQGDLDILEQAVKDVNASTDTDEGNPNLKIDDRDEYIFKIIELQDVASENAKDRFDEAFSEIQPTETGSEIVNKYIAGFKSITESHVAKERARAEQAYNQLMTDPSELSFKQARQRYYALMSFISDGYMLNASNFISDEATAILNTEVNDSDRIVPFNSRTGMALFQNSASFATNIRRLGNKMSELMFKLTTPFRAGIENAEKIQSEFVRPALVDAQQNAEKISGKKYTPYDLNLIGVYTLGKNYKTSETVAEGMMYNKRYFLDSIGKLENNFDPKMAESMAKMKENINLLYSGINPNMEATEALEIYERNATAMGIDNGMRQYSKDGIAIGEATRGLGKYTTEFVYGRQFTEWANYIPVFAIENPGVVHVDLNQLQSNGDDQTLGNLSDNTNMVTGGLGSTKERSRRLGQSKVLVFNFNAMVEGRTRVNVLDYMTASSRRELNNIINSKGTAFPQLANLLKDGGKHGDQGRISHVQKTIRTMWNNSIQNASYISEMQGIANTITNMWVSVKLSSFYQLPAQFASNLLPYFITNATNPQKIMRFFEASNMLLKYRAGTIKDERLKGTIERLLYSIESRQQDVFLDKSVALDVDGTGMFNAFKNTDIGRTILQGARTLNKVRENVLFWQFKTSDHLSGAPMLLAEYMDREVKAGRAVDWDGLTFNEESYFGSIDEIERFIGIGGASRRGVWLNGKNGWMTLFRNMVSAFSSHRINNATNFRGEWFKLTNNNLSTAERMESARYMTAIAGQSALFTIMKASMIGFFYNMLSDKMGEEENEKELEAYLQQLIAGNYRKEDRKVIEAEIALREKIRNEFKRVKDQAINAEVIGMNMLKDTVANAFVFPAITEVPLNAVIHAFYDQSEAEAFKLTKAATIADYKEKLEKAKSSRNTSEMIELQKQISQWESQEAIQMVYPNMSIIPFDGAYGGVLKDGYRFLEKGAGVLMGAETMSLNDMFMGLGLAGIGQADINRISRLVSKQQDYEKEYQESIDKIRAMEEAKNRR